MNALYREIADALRPVIREELRAELERQKEPPSPYMSVGEAAKVYGVTSRTIASDQRAAVPTEMNERG